MPLFCSLYQALLIGAIYLYFLYVMTIDVFFAYTKIFKQPVYKICFNALNMNLKTYQGGSSSCKTTRENVLCLSFQGKRDLWVGIIEHSPYTQNNWYTPIAYET